MKWTFFNLGILILTTGAIVKTIFFNGGDIGILISILGAMIFWLDEKFGELNSRIDKI